ncbi:hypothetical protein INR49_031405, partial [Caranx melampygus]
MESAPTPPSVLREFCPLYYLLNAIPAKGKCDAITAVKLLSCFDDLVAVGTASGRVAVFHLVSPLPGRNKQLKRFDVVGLHRGSVTSLAWSTNGMKLFSGDDKGRVVFTAVDLDQGVCKPVLLLEEASGVVQMEYSHQVLLVSTQQRSLLYCTQRQEIQQLGSKPRKSSGRFGACFLPALCKQSDLQVFAARPGLRLWRSDVRGQVEDTRLLKPLFNTQVPQFELFPRHGPAGAYRPADRQLGLLSCFLKDGWILSWNEYSIYVLDCVSEVIVGALESSGDIVSVSCCDNEIFILKGDRDIIRLSTSPEGLASNLSELSIRLSSPLTTPTVLPPTGSVETAQPIRTMAIIIEGGGSEERGREGSRLCEEGEREEEEEVEEAAEQEEQLEVMEQLFQTSGLITSSSHSRSSSITSWDSLHGNGAMTTGSELGSGTPLSDRASIIGLDLQNHESPEQNLDPGLQEAGGLSDGQNMEAGLGIENQQILGEASGPGPEEVVPPTPDVDLLLECTFSYMHNSEEDKEEHQPMEEQEFLSPLIGPDEEEEEEDEAVPPAAQQMFFSTMSSLDKEPSVSSDEDEDIYSLPAPGGGVSTHLCNLLWKVEQKSMTAFACAKVSAKGKRHWYKAVEQTAFVALSDDSAWIIRTNGDLYLQTALQVESVYCCQSNQCLCPPGLSVERPCARSVKVESPCVFSQVCVRGGVVWALSEHKALFYREGLNSYCSEGDGWKYDTVSEAQGLELMCVTLGDGGTAWALDASGSLWFRTGICSSRPQGEDDHWWQISISDYVVFDQGSLFQTLLQATQSVATVTRAPVERVVAFLSQYSQCQPSLVSANASGVWVASGRNQLHLARGRLVGTFWQNVVPRGTVSATRWSFITSSAVPHREGTFLWLAQSRKDLFCVWDQDGELRPSSVPLPPEVELTHLSACRDALWGLDALGRVSIRTLSPSCPVGLHWTPLDLSQLGMYLTLT